MADEGEARIAQLEDELKKERSESEKKIETLRKQQSESKAKAKAIIQRQNGEFRKKIAALEEDGRLKGDELQQVKAMLRKADEEKDKLTKQSTDLKNKVQALDEKVEKIEGERNEARTNENDLKTKLSQSEQEREILIQQIVNLQQSSSSTADEKQTSSDLPKDTDTSAPAPKAEQISTKLNADIDEEKKILEAKIAEMDRVVSSKQAEIGRVRDKARTYLKELNAEKRTMEDKHKTIVDELERQLDKEKENVKLMEQKSEDSTKEIDNCLAVIREKQKSMQMLKMNITSYKKVAEEAKQQTENLQSEFQRYKERARLALQEKENSTSITEADIDKATSNLRLELEKSRKETYEVRKRVEQLKDIELSVEEMKERTERAETVADLLRKDAAGNVTTNTNFSQVDRLQEKIMKLENELGSSKSQTEDVKGRHSTTQMRLESTEQALHNAELRTRNVEAKSKKSIDTLKDRIKQLETSLKKAQEASAAAQRTASAAAKALTFSSTSVDPSEESKENMARDRRDNSEESSHQNSNGYDAMELEANGGKSSSTLSAALKDTTDELGLRSQGFSGGLNDRTNDDEKNKNYDLDFSSAADIEAKEQQIAALITQLAELGALFDEVQRESELRGEQMEMLKAEVKNLDAKLVSAEKLKNGAPFSYLRTVVVRYLETDDATLLPVICNVLSFSEDESKRVKAARGVKASTSSSTGYFSIPFLGS